ncbi:metal ABC transporter solute-binding protein, Zn/Mn family [Aureibacillus halotolerans]|uniref:Zinc transport system substrate-binding protein n=1 Tax=Aureibacillus halotolerans TaxID=1508390 RepID=A0A4V3D4I4_9BACI|nr:zinc ABC transporter substrate-binding protein [Aureibacillus halotolerans]TDQ36397.1 zinc transport system substrate-binding protein [Aureibacillus halotolerans]
MNLRKLASVAFALPLVLWGCSNNNGEATSTANTGIESTDTLTIYTTIFPLQDFAQKIGGDYVDVKSVYPPGTDAHTFDPSSKEMIELADADLFIYNGVQLEPFADAAVETLQSEDVAILEATEGVDLISSHGHEDGEAHDHSAEEDSHDHSAEEHDHAEGETAHDHSAEEDSHDHSAEEHDHAEGETAHDHDGEKHSHSAEEETHDHSDAEHDHSTEESQHNHVHGEFDPHAWLDPIRAIEMAENIKDELVTLMPVQEEAFNENFETLKAQLMELDEEMHSMVESKEDPVILVSHAAYGYWESHYGIIQISITGLSPTQEPSQQQLLDIIAEAQEHSIEYVLFEQSVTPRVAETIQNEIGAESLTLNNMEVVTEEDIQAGEDYVSIMQMNIELLDKAMK